MDGDGTGQRQLLQLIDGRQPLGKTKFLMAMERKGYVLKKLHGIFQYKDTAVKESDFEDIGDEENPFDSA